MSGKKQHSGGQREGAGRPIARAIIRQGQGLMLSRVSPDGTADLGHGRAIVEGVGRSRVIKIAQADGSEIRILVVS